MTDRERAELLADLGELCKVVPEMRFGQLIANLAVVARGRCRVGLGHGRRRAAGGREGAIGPSWLGVARRWLEPDKGGGRWCW